MQIEIKNCNSIDNCVVQVRENTLNIKYGMNGTGKSTIVRAIELAVASDDTDSLSELTPFKYLEKTGGEIKEPFVTGLNTTKSIYIAA